MVPSQRRPQRRIQGTKRPCIHRQRPNPAMVYPTPPYLAHCSRSFNTLSTTDRAWAMVYFRNRHEANQLWLQHTPFITAVAVAFSVGIAGISGLRRTAFSIYSLQLLLLAVDPCLCGFVSHYSIPSKSGNPPHGLLGWVVVSRFGLSFRSHSLRDFSILAAYTAAPKHLTMRWI